MTRIDLRALILAAVVCVGIGVRYADLGRQFTHIDDLGVAESILAQDRLYDIGYVRSRIHDAAHSAHGSLPYRSLRWLDGKGQLESSLPALKGLFKLVVVPWVWTYAPFQFPLTSLLISSDQDYRSILFWGRFPSFLFSCLALPLVIAALRRIDGQGHFLPAFTSVLCLALAWENIIYAKHMSSYAIGVFAAVALLFMLASEVNRERVDLRSSATLAVALAAISHMQYQVLFFMPAFYLALLLARREATGNRRGGLRHLAMTGTIHAALCLPMVALFLLHRTQRGITWSGIFSFPILFDAGPGASLADRLAYGVEFFGLNGLRILDFLFALSPSAGRHTLFDLCLVLAMALGLGALLRSSRRTERSIGIFLLASGACIAALVLMQKLTFGPTRHALIFLPYLAVLASFGVRAAVEAGPLARLGQSADLAVAGVLAAAALAAFAPGFPGALAERRDLFEEREMAALIAKHNPEIIVAKAAGNMSLMAPSKDWPRQYAPGLRTYTLHRNPAAANAGTVMLVHFTAFTREDLAQIGGDFGLGADFGDPAAYAVLYRQVENTGACMDVCVERRTGDNAIAVEILAKRPPPGPGEGA